MDKTSNKKIAGAVIVTRVSTGKQLTGTSLEEQVEVCRAKALALGLPIVAEYSDPAISGAFLLLREGMQAAIADIQAGRADTLICASMSRYSRDTEHQKAILKAVRAVGGRVVFCDIEFEDSPEGDLMFGFIGGYAEYERQVIRKRTMNGKRRRAEDGIQTSRSIPPFGYHVPTRADILRQDYTLADIGRYVIVEPQATLVRNMYEWYAEGRYSLAAFARHLNSEGIPPPRGGKFWRESAIRFILSNPVYKGEAAYGRHTKRLDETRVGQPHALTGKPITSPNVYKLSDDFIPIPCPAIVSEELWDAAQERFKTNKTSQSGNPTRLKMLSGLVHCPGCGGTMVYKPERNRKGIIIPGQYTCQTHIKKQRLESEWFCDAKTYRQSDAEGAVVTAVLEAVQHPEWIETALETYRKAKSMPQEVVDYRKELQAIDRALELLEKEQAAAVKAQISGIMAGASPDAYAEVFADVAVRRKDLEDRRGGLSRASKVQRAGGVARQEQEKHETVLRDVRQVLTSPLVSEAEKRNFVGRVIEKVTCQKGGADVQFMPGLFGEVCNNHVFQTKPQTHQTVFNVLAACASYLGL